MRDQAASFRWMTAITLAAVTALASASGALAYTVITRSGQRIEAQQKPEVRGLQAYLRLAPSGQLAVIQEEQIDWERTAALNPAPRAIAIPAKTRMVERKPEAGAPIEKKITGTPGSRDTATGGEKTPPATPGRPDAKLAHAQEAIVKLQKEYAEVSAVREQEQQKRAVLEAELNSLKSRQVGPAGERGAAQERIRALEEQIAATDTLVGKLDSRLGDIRSQVVQLGGAID